EARGQVYAQILVVVDRVAEDAIADGGPPVCLDDHSSEVEGDCVAGAYGRAADGVATRVEDVHAVPEVSQVVLPIHVRPDVVALDDATLARPVERYVDRAGPEVRVVADASTGDHVAEADARARLGRHRAPNSGVRAGVDRHATIEVAERSGAGHIGADVVALDDVIARVGHAQAADHHTRVPVGGD